MKNKIYESEREVFSDVELSAMQRSTLDTKNSNLLSLLESINIANLTRYYPYDTETLFKKRIDKLNLKFYVETEKLVISPKEKNKIQNKLFLILFKEISIYIAEIERLNLLLIEKRNNNTHSNLISNLKLINKNLEKKLKEKAEYEEKKKNEIEKLKRQLLFYKDRIKIDGLIKKKEKQFYHKKDYSTINASAYLEHTPEKISSQKTVISKSQNKNLKPYLYKSEIAFSYGKSLITNIR